MRLGSRLLVIYICIFFSFLIQSCSRRESVPHPPKPDPCDVYEEQTKNVDASVFFDASGSMKGFVNPGKSTIYCQVIKPIKDSFLGTTTNVKFYKFSDVVKELPGRDFLEALDPGFYSGQDTNIQKALSNPGGLTVIVTDLFQKDDDVTLLVEVLEERMNALKAQCQTINHPDTCLNLCIGVLGIKSQFNGIIANGKAFPWGNLRPFYIVMLGKHADVVNYFGQLKSCNSKYVTDENLSLLSRHLTNLFSPKDINLIPPPGTSRGTANFVRTELIIRPKVEEKHFNVGQLIIRNRSKEVNFVAEFNCELLPYILNFDPKNLEVDVTAEKLQEIRKTPDDQSKPKLTGGKKDYQFEQDLDASLNINIVAKELLDGKKIKLSAKIQPGSLMGKSIYRYRFTFRPSNLAYQEPDWWAEWDMGFVENDGSKTLNLNRFMTALKRVTNNLYRPKIADFYCYVKTK